MKCCKIRHTPTGDKCEASSVLKLSHACVLLAWEIRLWLGLLPVIYFHILRFVKKITKKIMSFCQPFFMNLLLLLLHLCWCSLFTKTTLSDMYKNTFSHDKERETWHIKSDLLSTKIPPSSLHVVIFTILYDQFSPTTNNHFTPCIPTWLTAPNYTSLIPNKN